MLPGVSTACFYPGLTEDSLSTLSKEGVAATEIFLNSYCELDREYLRELRRIADDGGVKILSVHPFLSGLEPMLFFSRYHRRFQDGREIYKRFYEAAGLLGGDIVVFHGNTVHMPVEDAFYFERYQTLLEDASAQGVRLCHENVCRCSGRTPGFFRRLRRALPEAQFVLDTKQALRGGETIEDFLAAMDGNIAHVHISDHGAAGDCLTPGKGDFNIPKFLMTLRGQGFSGGVIVELYRENYDTIVELLQGYQHLSNQICTMP